MVAPSFKDLYDGAKPYDKGGKLYVKLKTGREVRWWSAAEYAKKWPSDKINAAEVDNNQKHLLGFDEGYIWIITSENENKYYNWLWNHASYSTRRRWHRNGYTSWYLSGYTPDENEPQEPVAPFPLIKLTWEEISKDGKILEVEKVREICDKKRRKNDLE